MEDRVLGAIRRLNRGVALLAGVALMICAAFVLADIVLRQMGSSFGGTDEISGYVMAITTSWGMAFTLLELGHIRIDLLRARAVRLGRALFDLFAMLALTGTVTLVAYKCWPVVERSLANGSRANTPLGTPLSLVQLPWFAGWVWFALMAWLTCVAAALLLLKGRFHAVEAAIGCFGEDEGAGA